MTPVVGTRPTCAQGTQKKVDQWSKKEEEKKKSQSQEKEKKKKKKKVGGVLPRERAVDPPPVRQHPVGVT